jgi:hypothetical protein
MTRASSPHAARPIPQHRERGSARFAKLSLMAARILFETAHLNLLEALPELVPAYDRLCLDCANFEGEPPGQYTVFSDLLGVWLEVLLRMSADTSGRDEALSRATGFGENLLSCDDQSAREVAMDSYADAFISPSRREEARRFGGPALLARLDEYFSDYRGEADDDVIIDLWGVREMLKPLLPDSNWRDIPGCSRPADHYEIDSSEVTRNTTDAALLFCDHGHTDVYLVAPVSMVRATAGDLNRAVHALAPHFHHLDRAPEVHSPQARWFIIPAGEKVWNMDSEAEEDRRFEGELIIHPSLTSYSSQIRDLLAGERSTISIG